MKVASIALAAAVAAAAAVLAGGFAVPPYAAVVNGTQVTQAQLNSDLAAIQHNQVFLAQVNSQQHVSGQGSSTLDSQFVASVLSGRISLVLIDQALARRGITITAEDLRLARSDVVASFSSSQSPSGAPVSPGQSGQAVFDGFPSSYRSHLLEASAALTALEASIGHVDVSEAGMARYYAANRSEFTLTCVSDIAVGSQAQALDILAQLNSGADFASLAQANSSDNPQLGGSLGCNPPGTFVASVEGVVDALKVGQVSVPFQVGSSWHLVKVTSRAVQPFSAVTSAIRQRMLAAASGRITGALQALQARADVHVNPEYGAFVKRPGQTGVVPPIGPPSSMLTMPGPSGP